MNPPRPAPSWVFFSAMALSLPLHVGCESRKVGAVTARPLVLELVEKESGKPCPGVTAEAFASGRLLSGGTSGETGRIELPRSFPGRVIVRLQDPHERFLSQELEVTEPGSHRLELLPGAMVRLRVLGPSGSPLPRAEVTAWPFKATVPWATVQRFTLKEGRQSFGPLPPGLVKLLIASPGHRTAALELNLKLFKKKTGSEDLHEVRLLPGGNRLRGRVISVDGRPPRDALLRWDGAGQLAELDAQGRFEFTGLPGSEAGAALGKAMLVLRRGQKELYARDVELGDSDLDLGVIELNG